MTKYSSHWNSEAEIKLPPLPSIPTTKVGSTHGTDERHLRPVISDKPVSDYGIGAKPVSEYGVGTKPSREYGIGTKPVSEYGIGATNSAPTSTISKKGLSANLLSSFSYCQLCEHSMTSCSIRILQWKFHRPYCLAAQWNVIYLLFYKLYDHVELRFLTGITVIFLAIQIYLSKA